VTTLQAKTHCEESVQFSDLVFDQLCALVLESANCQASPKKAQVGFHSLASLATTDKRFAEWISRHFPNLPQLPGLATDRDWDCFLSHLIALNVTCSKVTLIKNAASVALRLRTLERAFDRELDQVKLNAIYQLAYGLSHELNNPLANITVRASVLLKASKSPEERSLLETIVDNSARGSEMLGDLMLIAGPPVLNPKPTDLKKLFQETENRCRSWTKGSQISLRTDWPLDGTAMVDSFLINEVIWALVRNAIEASSNGQSIFVKGFYSDHRICVYVEDEGQGLSDEALRSCFDPFFSGREAGRGLGIGLAKAKRFAKLHGGDVTLVNLPIRGCRASFCFKSCD
jgi:signal transduction histidine kinase